MPPRGYAPDGPSLAAELRRWADDLEAGIESADRIVVTVERPDGKLDTFVIGKSTTNAYVVGLLHIAATNFMRTVT